MILSWHALPAEVQTALLAQLPLVLTLLYRAWKARLADQHQIDASTAKGTHDSFERLWAHSDRQDKVIAQNVKRIDQLQKQLDASRNDRMKLNAENRLLKAENAAQAAHIAKQDQKIETLTLQVEQLKRELDDLRDRREKQ